MKRIAIAFLFLLPTSLFAWTRSADQRIAQKSAEFAPRDLHLLLQRFAKPYAHGVDRGLAEEGTDIHREHLRQRIEQETTAIVSMIRSNQPMSAVVERLGMLAHLVGDANNPFHMTRSDADLEPSHNDFEHYFERRMQLFPTVVYGIDRHLQLSDYLDAMFARTEKLAPLMSEEYFRDGERRNSAEFDDRSTAFGVASICYSHAVTDTANLYTYIWREAGGDVRASR